MYQKFISGTARAILSFKRHPTTDEWNKVSLEIVKKYPFLRTPGSKPEVGVKYCWRNIALCQVFVVQYTTAKL